MAKHTARKCIKCDKKSLPGLLTGYCRYHWAELNWGKAWADKVCHNVERDTIKETLDHYRQG